MDAAAIHARLRERFPNAVGELTGKGQPAITVEPHDLVAVATFSKTDPELAFDCLSNQSGVDYPKRGEIEVVCHLFSYRHRHAIVLKVPVPRDAPTCPTLASVWRTAIWLEREIFDLLGVTFAGHPDLRRILLPEDWVGFPLRKDYVEPAEYHGITTTRDNLLDPSTP